MPTPEFQPRPVKVSKVDVFRRFLLYIIGAGVVVSNVLGFYQNHQLKAQNHQLVGIVAAIRGTQVQNTGISRNTNLTSHQVHQLLTTVKDCITPSGKCAQANAKAIAGVISKINNSSKRNTILTAVCENTADVPNTPVAISRCVAHFINVKEN